MQQVTIGGRDHRENIAPLIGDDVYIGAGARVLGDVRIGQGVVIGANAVVTRDIPPGVTVVGANRIVPTPRTPRADDSTDDVAITQLPGRRPTRTPRRQKVRRAHVAVRESAANVPTRQEMRIVPISATLAGL